MVKPQINIFRFVSTASVKTLGCNMFTNSQTDGSPILLHTFRDLQSHPWRSVISNNREKIYIKMKDYNKVTEEKTFLLVFGQKVYKSKGLQVKRSPSQKGYKSKGPQVKRATSQKVPSQKVPSQKVYKNLKV